MSRRVWLFGTLRIEQDDRPLTPGGKPAGLFAYLALHPGQPHRRERLADLFFPDALPERAGRNLSALLYRLRQSLGPGWLDADDERVALRPGPDLWVDAREFEALAGSNDPDARKRAIALYHDDLLPEIYDDWILPLRVALRERFLHACARLARESEADGHAERAFEFYHRLVFAEPLDDESQRGLMRVYARMGRYAAALQQYERFRQLLEDELGARPLPETQRLAEQIRAEHLAQETGAAEEKPFIGRRRERSRLIELVEQGQNGRGGIVLVEGEAGLGKTSLLEKVGEGAAWRGVSVVWGRARELTGVTPCAPLDEAFRAACTGPRSDQLRARLALPVAETLAGLEPRLRTGTPLKTTNPPALASALAEGLCALSGITPHLFILDDVQWAEATFWDALLELAPKIETQRLLILLAYRVDEVRADAATWRALRRLDREFAPPRLSLDGLNEAECVELARTLGRTVDETTARDLRQQTNGNPLFVTNVLETGSTAATLADLLSRRVARLGRIEREVLEAGAALGREFSHGAWQALAGAPVLEAIPALVAARFIRETASGYQFEHDLTREYIYNAIPPERRREWHRRAGEVLAQERAEPGVLAWHFVQAEAWREAVRFYREAGERAANAFAYETALAYFGHVQALLPRLDAPQDETIALLVRRQRVYRVTVQKGEWRATVDQLESAASAADDRAALLEALQARVSLGVLEADWAAMLDAARRAVALAQEDANPNAEARVRAELGWHLADMLGRPHEALPHLERAAALAEQLGDTSLRLETLGHLAFAQRITGGTLSARATAELALQIANSRGDLLQGKAGALEILGQVEIDLARWQSAYEIMGEFTQLALDLKDRWLAGQGLFNQAFIAAHSGRHADAQHAIQSLKSLLAEAGIGPPEDHWMWAEALNANALTLAGDLEQAECSLDSLRAWMDTKTGGRPLLLALTALGRLRLAQNRPDDARVALTRALDVWKQSGGTIEVAPLLLHALASSRTSDLVAATASLRHAESVLEGTQVAAHNVLLHIARYELTGDPRHLRAARDEIQRQAALFTDDALRAAFLEGVALHREIEARWQALHPPPPRLTVRLARAETPLGKPLREADFVPVQWTVDAGEADGEFLRRYGKAALRRHRLARLIREAHEQNAAPTDADLAGALSVNVRTIERDIAALIAEGHKARTRKRK